VLPALQRLTPSHLNRLYAELLAYGRIEREGGLSARTVRYCHTILRRALADAVRWNRLPRNVADSADPPTKNATTSTPMRTWTAEQLRAFLGSVRDDRLHTAYVLLASTGARRGEILGLRWRDVDLDAARISIRQTLVSVDYRAQFSEPKTAKGRRNVALDPATVSALREHAERQALERAIFGDAGLDLVFSEPDGSPLHPHQFSQAFKIRTKQAGLPTIRLHDLRHTYATLALQAGVHPKVVSERLGHASVSITLDTYSHAIPAMEETAASLVAALFLGD
jgi:integrase